MQAVDPISHESTKKGNLSLHDIIYTKAPKKGNLSLHDIIYTKAPKKGNLSLHDIIYTKAPKKVIYPYMISFTRTWPNCGSSLYKADIYKIKYKTIK